MVSGTAVFIVRDDMMERINESGYKAVSYSTIHKHLGKRGVQVGRRPRDR